MRRALRLSLLSFAALLGSHESLGQTPPTRPRAPIAVPPSLRPGPQATPSTPGGGAAGTPGAGGTPGSNAGGAGTPPAGGAAGAGAGPGGTATGAGGDTGNLPQFEQGVEFEPKSPNYKVAFSLEDADLPELVRVIGQLTGKRFIFGGKVRNIKASVYSPQKVTVAEAYQAFLSILETNGLTVIPHGRFLKIVETGGVATQDTPLYAAGQGGAPPEDRYVTRIHRLSHVSAEEVSNVLGHFKTKDGDITVYAPGNLLIITDTGSNIRRMMQIVEDVDVGAAGDQIWIEPVHYGSASDIANRINELFDIKGGAASAPAGGKGAGGHEAAAVAAGTGDLHIAKLIADDRTNSIIIVATERAYLRILEIIKRLDVPQTGEGEIHVLPLQHADSVELTKTLQEIITGAGAAATPGGATPAPNAPRPGGSSSIAQGIFEGGVKVSADKATNSIVITSSLRDYASLRAVVDRLDQPRKQVFIDAVVMDLSITRSNQLGFNFHGADTVPTGSLGSSLLYGGLNPLKTILLPDPSTLQGLALGVRGPGIPGSENLLGTGLTIPAFGVVINALASDGDADVLSTPHILATDNIAAEINVGENIPLQQNAGITLPGAGGAPGAAGGASPLGFGFPTIGGSGARSDVGTKIKIVPHLNESDEVRLELTEEISEAEAAQGQLGVVPISKRNAATQLIVHDQQTVVIGGLMRSRVTHSRDKIPLLGDIPVLGALFRNTTDTMQKTNLLLILTPFIIREQSDLRTVFERKMQERQEFLDRYFVFSDANQYQPPHDYSRAYGLIEQIRQSFMSVDEKKLLDEAARPKAFRGHEPGVPLEMPAVIHGTSGASEAPPPPTAAGNPAPAPAAVPSPNLNVQPPARNVDRVER
jgi:general secretion pathway protein D